VKYINEMITIRQEGRRQGTFIKGNIPKGDKRFGNCSLISHDNNNNVEIWGGVDFKIGLTGESLNKLVPQKLFLNNYKKYSIGSTKIRGGKEIIGRAGLLSQRWRVSTWRNTDDFY